MKLTHDYGYTIQASYFKFDKAATGLKNKQICRISFTGLRKGTLKIKTKQDNVKIARQN
jgi:hypothetical protein